MARKTVEVLTPEGSRYFVKNSVAHKMSVDGDAVFTDGTRTRMQAVPKILKASGRNNTFLAHWALIPSGGIPVWQYLST